MMEKLLIVVHFVWKVGIGVLKTYKSNIMPLLWQSCHELHKSRVPVNQQKEFVGKGWRLPVCLFGLKSETHRLHCSLLDIKR